MYDTFSDQETTTMGADFTNKTVNLENDKKMDLYIWDTNGSEKYRSVNSIFYKDSAIAILVFDLTDKKTFEELKKFWVNEINENGPRNISNFNFIFNY